MIILHAVAAIPWHVRYSNAISSGLNRHNIKTRLYSNRGPRFDERDIHILLGPHRGSLKCGRYIIFNRKFVGNNDQDVVAISWDGFNGHGTFCVNDDYRNNKRLFKYLPQASMQADTSDENKKVSLLCEQYDTGRCTKYARINDWYREVKQNDKVISRPKPDCHQNPTFATLSGFRRAHVLNSTVSVDLIQHGIPVLSWDNGDPCWAITQHSLEEPSVISPYRLDFFKYLSQCQWDISEIADGSWWDRMKIKTGPKLNEWTPPTV